ncbi:MAG: hypothetical protein M1820_008352 [Bogoriella megaspora]|nr:MAG: hypothetical protein M1820_008352 [Bogoriella megaspora]
MKELASFSNNGRGGHLPSHRMYSQTQQGMPQISQDIQDLIFLLLCVPYQRHAAKMLNVDVMKVGSDREFFNLLRQQYHSHRGRLRKNFALRGLAGIKFVQFEVYRNELADIHKVDSLPSETLREDYTYQPMPANHIPPIGPNLMKHLCDHPEDASNIDTCFRKVPRKLKSKLVACPIQGSSSGWGIQFVEGIDWFKVSICGLLAVLSSSSFGILWSVLRNDVQGGFTVAGFMLTTLLCLLTTVQSSLGVI